VNCRIQWIIESLNAHCAPRYSVGHACSSVIWNSSYAWCWASVRKDSPQRHWQPRADVAPSQHICERMRLLEAFHEDHPSRLTSDQVGIPAELKHINKRRKRNQQGLP